MHKLNKNIRLPSLVTTVLDENPENLSTGLWQRQGEPQDRSVRAIPDIANHSTEQVSSFQSALKLRE